MTDPLRDQDGSPPRSAPDVSSSFVLPPRGPRLEQLISLITPPAALVWPALPASLPWTTPPGGGRTRPSDARLSAALTEAGVPEPEAQWYILNGPYTEIMVEGPRDLHRKYGFPARSIEVAVEADVVGADLLDISARLDLTDHLHAADARSARRYLNRGRSILGSLGVWPWAHVPRWHAKRPWWTQQATHRALTAWHDRSWMSAAQRLAGSARARYGHPSVRTLRVEEFDACRAFRDELARATRARRPDG